MPTKYTHAVKTHDDILVDKYETENAAVQRCALSNKNAIDHGFTVRYRVVAL